MINKYYKIFELLEDILKVCTFENREINIGVLSSYKLIGRIGYNNNGYILGVYSEAHSSNNFVLKTLNVDYDTSYKSCTANIISLQGGAANIKDCEILDIHNKQDVESLRLSTGINLSTGEGSDEIFQMSLIHPQIVTDTFALASHYKHHGLHNIYSFGINNSLPENALDILITRLQEIKGTL